MISNNNNNIRYIIASKDRFSSEINARVSIYYRTAGNIAEEFFWENWRFVPKNRQHNPTNLVFGCGSTSAGLVKATDCANRQR